MNHDIDNMFAEWLLKNKVSTQDIGILNKIFKDAFILGFKYKNIITAEEYLQK